MTQTECLEQFIDSLDTQVKKVNYRSNILNYLIWRKITIEELVVSGKKEIAFLDQYVAETKLALKHKTKITRVGIVKQFLRFHGHSIKARKEIKKVFHFANDQAMIDFLLFAGKNERSKQNASIALASYCKFRNKTPSELLIEAKTLSKPEIRILIAHYFNFLQIKTKNIYINVVLRFYRYLADIVVDLPSNLRSHHKNKEIQLDKQLVDNRAERRGRVFLCGDG